MGMHETVAPSSSSIWSHIQSIWIVAVAGDAVSGSVRCDDVSDAADDVPPDIPGSGRAFAQKGLQLCEGAFDGIEVGTDCAVRIC